MPQANLAGLTWRDRARLVNSVLFCIAGGALITRYFTEPSSLTAVILGSLFLAFGIYRLALARRELQKRARTSD